jgi:hypothetical protein
MTTPDHATVCDYVPPGARCFVCRKEFSFLQRSTPGRVLTIPGYGPVHAAFCTMELAQSIPILRRQVDAAFQEASS